MLSDRIQQVCLKRFLNAEIKRLFGIILIFVAILIQQAKAQDLVLQDTTITTTTTFSASNSIAAGPNFTIASTGAVTFEYGNSITLTPSFVIIGGGQFYALTDITTGIETKENPALPTDFIVQQNYPNPFNPTTEIRYTLSDAQNVQVVIYNTFGQVVRTLISQNETSGYHSVIWDGTSKTGDKVSSGIYYYKVTAGKHSVTKKMTLIK